MLNYIGLFLTFDCDMGCDYCLNRQGDFKPRKRIPYQKWMEITAPLEIRQDLPITLQGGEPTMYKDFYKLVKALHERGNYIDLLTNGDFDERDFLMWTTPETFRRTAPYASIRFSLHKNTDDVKLVARVNILRKAGYSVGVWGITHPDMAKRNRIVRAVCAERGIDYREKEYLDSTHGTYKYPDAVTGKKNITVMCTPSEMLFAPDGKRFPCHHYLYMGDDRFIMPEHQKAINCGDYGLCNPCDIKLKTNRLQIEGHCSVEIERI